MNDWVQCEYDRTKLPDSQLVDLHYHEDDSEDSLGLAVAALCEPPRPKLRNREAHPDQALSGLRIIARDAEVNRRGYQSLRTRST